MLSDSKCQSYWFISQITKNKIVFPIIKNTKYQVHFLDMKFVLQRAKNIFFSNVKFLFNFTLITLTLKI